MTDESTTKALVLHEVRTGAKHAKLILREVLATCTADILDVEGGKDTYQELRRIISALDQIEHGKPVEILKGGR